LTKVGEARLHNAMFHDYRACQVFRVRYDCLHNEQQIMTVGVKKLNFDSRMRNVFRIVRYKTDSKNVSGCRGLLRKIDKETQL